MGSGERNGVRVWVRQSMIKSAVASSEKKGGKSVINAEGSTGTKENPKGDS